MLKKIFIAFILTWLLVPELVVADTSYSKGYAKYVEGDFVGAAKYFKVAVDEAVSSIEKSRAYKMLGIVFYMQGARGNAEKSFIECRRLNSSARISPSEVLDQSVIEFFDSIEVDGSNTPRMEETQVSDSPDRSRQTYIQVKCNTEAQIWIKGELSGKCGDIVPIKAGSQEVKVTKQGYTDRLAKVNIKPGVLNLLQISLQPLPQSKVQVSSPKPEEKAPIKTTKKPVVNKSEDDSSSLQASSGSPAPISFYHFLPLGIGQFYNHSNNLGVAFCAIHLMTMGFYGYSVMDYNSTVDSFNSEDNQRRSDGFIDREEYEEYLAWRATKQTRLDAKSQTINYAIALIVVSYAAAVTEAIIDRPKTSTRADVWRISPDIRVSSSSSPTLGLSFTRAFN